MCNADVSRATIGVVAVGRSAVVENLQAGLASALLQPCFSRGASPSLCVPEHRKEVAGAAAEHEQMPDEMAKAQP